MYNTRKKCQGWCQALLPVAEREIRCEGKSEVQFGVHSSADAMDTFWKSITSFNPLSTHFPIGTLQEKRRRRREIKVTCLGSTEGEGKSKLNVKYLPGSQILEITFNLTKDNRNKLLIQTSNAMLKL